MTKFILLCITYVLVSCSNLSPKQIKSQSMPVVKKSETIDYAPIQVLPEIIIYAKKDRDHVRYLAALYTKDWIETIKRIGRNLEIGSTASLTMNVAIMADGDISSIALLKSSGNQALDDTAIRIVRLAAPFAAVPIELLNEEGVFNIYRKWSFRVDK